MLKLPKNSDVQVPSRESFTFHLLMLKLIEGIVFMARKRGGEDELHKTKVYKRTHSINWRNTESIK